MEQSTRTIKQLKKKNEENHGKIEENHGTIEENHWTNAETSRKIDEQCEWEILATKCSKWEILAAKTKEGSLDDQKKMKKTMPI